MKIIVTRSSTGEMAYLTSTLCAHISTLNISLGVVHIYISILSIRLAHGPHLRHHLMGHESLDGSQTQLGDLWLFGATAHQKRLHDLRAVLLQSCRQRTEIKLNVTVHFWGGEFCADASNLVGGGG